MIQLHDFKISQLAKPSAKISKSPFVPVETFDLPNNFCIHYVTDVISQIGMRGANPLIRNWSINGGIGLYHVEAFKTLKHGARSKVISKAVISKYFQSQSVFTKVTKLERSLTRERQLLVMDYSALLAGLISKEGIYKFYHEFDNMAEAIVDNIVNTTSVRNNIIQLRMPEVLPDRSAFNKIDEEPFSSDDATYWTEYDQLWLRELWQLLHGRGVLNKAVEKSSVYVSISIAGTILTLDLKRLKEYGAEELNAAKTDLYKLFDTIKQMETSSDEEALDGVEEASPSEMANADEAILEVTKERLRSGRMTATEQARFVKLAKEAGQIELSNGQTIDEYSVIQEEDYVIDDELNTSVNEKIIPKNRAKSTVSGFHKSYINKVMDKHLVNVANAFTNTGYILRDFDIDEQVDAINHNRVIKMTIMPIEGKETTIELPVPVIQGNGQFKADGIMYSQDIQKVSKHF